MKKKRQTWKDRGQTKLTVEKGALKVFWVDLRRASSALGEGPSWTSGGTREVLVLPNWARINRLEEFLYMCIWYVLIFVLYYMNVMPLYDKKISLSTRFWKIPRNRLAALSMPPGDAWILTQFWVFCDEPPGGKGSSAKRCEYCTKILFFVLFA